MTKVLHSAPRYASFEGVLDSLLSRLGDVVVASKEEHGEIVLTALKRKPELL